MIPITVYSFVGQRVGNLEFKNRCDEAGHQGATGCERERTSDQDAQGPLQRGH